MTQDLSDTAFHLIIFDSANSFCFWRCALITFGAAGPSGASDLHWRHLCTAFGTKSDSLCDALAMTSHKLAIAVTDPRVVQTLTASRLIGLDKNRGVKRNGIGEFARSIISKSILRTILSEILGAPLINNCVLANRQLAESGFNQSETKGVHLVVQSMHLLSSTDTLLC